VDYNINNQHTNNMRVRRWVSSRLYIFSVTKTRNQKLEYYKRLSNSYSFTPCADTENWNTIS